MKPKFRAWDKSNKKMCDVKALSAFNGGEVTIKRDGENASYVVPIERVILMQSTGLFDKNGVEIFDGDIVKLQYTIASDFELFEVRQFRGGMWRIDNRRRGSDLWLRNEDCEVIGNIYQNSDLIESVEE
ncbi:TPA: hypothetical protein VPF83_000471 [Streptococcus pyogenes]|nr:YopX family protein [Streptococcus pyogenes]HER4823803.1 hypothetical protein [Streptococcus pyogenes NGAS015]AIQ01382.1 hypothetical protein FE90_0615 [Streptococcus pyogenes]MCX2499634.1 YopX family protein [Streptococcus pyogenes]MCX2507737.1 YopX family protein [Streptococcus pyogenes]QCK57733.1 hypothetical protein ETT54_05130 [Streptococcus pyogenes]